MSIPVALQLYSVRDVMEKDVAGTLRAVAEMGYAGVEFAGFYGQTAQQLRDLLDATGLRCAGTHTWLTGFDEENLEATMDDHRVLGAPFALIPWLPEERRNSPEACRSTAEWFTRLAERVRGSGIQVGFHAHDSDMRLLANGESAWDVLARNTPEDFVLQYDTANGISGGADPVKPILEFPGRSHSVHLKESAQEGEPAIIGTGRVPWAEVFAACESVGDTKWYVVEAEIYGDLTSMEVAQKNCESLKNLHKV
jgi:sugar phosphate isomerase/epimerase